MTKEILDSAAKYVIAILVLVGCFVLIYTGTGDDVQAWTVAGLIVGWIVRDSAGNAASANTARVAAAAAPITVIDNTTPNV